MLLCAMVLPACNTRTSTTAPGGDAAAPSRGQPMSLYLNELLKAESPSEFNALLLKHGPVVRDEVPVLAAKARDGNARVRLNAARLLTLAPIDDREAALRAL